MRKELGAVEPRGVQAEMQVRKGLGLGDCCWSLD
jgi:hypothetical protein